MEEDTQGHKKYVVWRVHGRFHMLIFKFDLLFLYIAISSNFTCIYYRVNVLFVHPTIYGLKRTLKHEVHI